MAETEAEESDGPVDGLPYLGGLARLPLRGLTRPAGWLPPFLPAAPGGTLAIAGMWTPRIADRARPPV